jgi:hypothetical protein
MSWKNDEIVGKTKAEEKSVSSAVAYTRDVLRQMPRQLGLAARNVVTGATALPGIAADVTMSGVNALLPSNMQQDMPSAALQNFMSRVGLPEAETGTERFSGMVQAGLTGSRIDPMAAIAALRSAGTATPSAIRGAGPLATPQNVTLPTPKQETFYEGRGQGYVVPPATIRSDMPTQIAESFSGKRLTAEVASERNQDVSNMLAARALGLSENQPITQSSLKAVRTEAGKVYAQISNSGRIQADPQYKTDIDAIAQNVQKIAADFGDLDVGARKEIEKLAKDLSQPNFSSEGAVILLRQLRDDATRMMKSENAKDANLGMAQRAAANALEGAIMRHLRRIGRDDLADNFNKARTSIAKSHDVEAATNFATGEVNPRVFERLLANGEPLSGELALIGRMGAAFPRSMTPRRDSTGVTALDLGLAGGGVGAGFLAQDPLIALAGASIPVLRRGVTRGLLSDPVQNVLSRPYPGIPGRTAGATGGVLMSETEEEQRRRRGR